MAAEADLTFDQGSTWRRRFEWADEDEQVISLAEYTGAQLQVRRKPADQDSGPALVTLVTGAGLEIVDDQVVLEVAASVTTDVPAGMYVYDLELLAGDEVDKMVTGRWTVKAEVTRV